MAKETLQSKYRRALEKRGWALNPNSKTTRYLEMAHPTQTVKIYIGDSGALRQGMTTANTRPVSAQFKSKLLLEASDK